MGAIWTIIGFAIGMAEEGAELSIAVGRPLCWPRFKKWSCSSYPHFETDLLTQVRGLVGLQFWPRVSSWIGVTLNYQVSFGPNERLVPTFFPVPVVLTDPQRRGGHQLWPGVAGGLRF
jgi:hypothetical protein